MPNAYGLSNGYATRAAPPSPFWTPTALSLPQVTYPTPYGASTPATPRRLTRDETVALNWQRSGMGQQTPPVMDTFGSVKRNWGSDTFGSVPRNTYTVQMPGGGGGDFYGGGASGGGLAGDYQAAMDRANALNEARYQDILGGYQSRYERGLNMLAGLGQQEGRDVNEAYDAQGAKIQQNLIGRGLGNSTVLSTMRMGNERERNADLGRLNERVRQQALAQDAGLSGDTLQFMERKTENGPSAELLAQLAQGAGAAGYGGGYGGYGGGMDLAAVNADGSLYGAGGGGGLPMMPFGRGGYAPRGNTFQQQRQAAAQANWAAKNAGTYNGPTANQRAGYGTTLNPVGAAYRAASVPTGVGSDLAAMYARGGGG